MKPTGAVILNVATLAGGTLALAALLLMPLPLTGSTPASMAFHDALHTPLFAVATVVIFSCLRKILSLTRKQTLVSTALVALILAGSSELAQGLFARTASWLDFFFDSIGIALAAGTIVVVGRRRSPRSLRRALALAFSYLAALTVVGLPVSQALDAENQQETAFPTLGNFEDEWQSLLWHANGEGKDHPVTASRSSSYPSEGKYSLALEADSAAWAGVHVGFARRLPWSGKQSLCFDVFNPGDNFELGLRIDGFDGERFSGAVQIAPGRNFCRLAFSELKNNQTNLEGSGKLEARLLTFHLGKSRSTRIFYLDNVRLE